jgi:hypothetical protein
MDDRLVLEEFLSVDRSYSHNDDAADFQGVYVQLLIRTTSQQRKASHSKLMGCVLGLGGLGNFVNLRRRRRRSGGRHLRGAGGEF